MILYYEHPCFECYGTGEIDSFNGACPTCMGYKALFYEVTDPKMLRTALKELTKKSIIRKCKTCKKEIHGTMQDGYRMVDQWESQGYCDRDCYYSKKPITKLGKAVI